MPGPLPRPLIDRTWEKVNKTDSCWLWTGARNDKGYGVIWENPSGQRRSKRAHRIIYEAVIGPVPEGLVLEHRCRVRHCVRPGPGHVEPDTQRNNVLLGIGPTAANAAKQTCEQGHPLVQVAARGDRGCRICINARVRGER